MGYTVTDGGLTLDMIEIGLKLGLHPRELEDKRTFERLSLIGAWLKTQEQPGYGVRAVLDSTMAKLGFGKGLDDLYLYVKLREDADRLNKVVASMEAPTEGGTL